MPEMPWKVKHADQERKIEEDGQQEHSRVDQERETAEASGGDSLAEGAA
jgi:hypothetical protein